MATTFSIDQLLTEYGSPRRYTSPAGNQLLVFPTCPVPIEHLFEENWNHWDRTTNHGNFRRVRHISQLENGLKTALYVKSPEIRFTASHQVLERGEYWWGGVRSGEQSVVITDHPLIWEQSEWEAFILIGLYSARIRAEIPYALSYAFEGRKELIVGEVKKESVFPGGFPLLNYEGLRKAITSQGFAPEDFAGHNLLRTSQDDLVIIDVNRWRRPPYTDQFDQKLFTLVRERAVLSSRSLPYNPHPNS